MTTPAMLTAPYVSVAEFKAAPTYVDVDDLIPEGSQVQQDAELYNVLLRASAWADSYCRGDASAPWFGAHVVTEQCRSRINRNGEVFLHPCDIPVRSITGVAFGGDFQNLTALSDLTQTWVEDGRGIVVSVFPNRGAWAGRLEFGSSRGPGGLVYVQYQYVAGYACTALSANVNAAASSLSVIDGTGITGPSTSLVGGLDGSTLRIWDPGAEEAVKVGQGYTAGSTTLPLVSPLSNPHVKGTAVSEMPAEVRMAVITYAVALILREEAGEGGGSFGPSLRKIATAGSPAGLIADAQNFLEGYRRVR